MTDVIVLIGAGSIGQAIARRLSAGKKLLLADIRPENAGAAAKVLADAGFDVSTATVDVSSRQSVEAIVEKAISLGDVMGLIHAAGVSPSQAPPEVILKVDLYGTALVLELFGNVMAHGGSGVVIASMAGHRLPGLPVEENAALAGTPVEELPKLSMLQPDRITNSGDAYMISKRANALRVGAEALRWAKRGARINSISPGIIITPLARDELTGPLAEGYRKMLADSPAPRRNSGRSRGSRRAPHGPRRCLHHRQRLPDGRRSDRELLVRQPCQTRNRSRQRSPGERGSLDKRNEKRRP